MTRDLLEASLAWNACRATFTWSAPGTLCGVPELRQRDGYVFVTLDVPVCWTRLVLTTSGPVRPWVGVCQGHSWLVYAAEASRAGTSVWPALAEAGWRWFSARGTWHEASPFDDIRLANEFGILLECPVEITQWQVDTDAVDPRSV